MRDDADGVDAAIVVETLPNALYRVELDGRAAADGARRRADRADFSGCCRATGGGGADAVRPDARTHRETGLSERRDNESRSSVKKICVKCKVVRRQGVVRIICANQKHKQRQG